MPKLLFLTLFLAAALGQDTTFEGQPALELANSNLKMTLFPQGAIMANLVMTNDAAKLSPLWNPVKLARDAGRPATFGASFGHFVCVDGFGQPSAEERTAGLPGHGEAHLLNLAVTRAKDSVTMKGTLPLLQENFTRTFRMVEGESVIYVDSILENLLAFDRPVAWAEHATAGAPFLEAGKAAVYLSGTRSQTRPYVINQPGRGPGPARTQRRLKPGIDFTWPLAPGLDGTTVDLSEMPANPHFLDHSATQMDPNRQLEWAVILNTDKHLIYGYVFRRDDYPWMQHWGNYPSPTELVRGLEFGTQPYDVPRREAISMGSLFGTPTYRWLPAKGKIESHFLMFYAAVPANLHRVDDVKLEGGKIIISDASGTRLELAASKGL